MPKLLFLLRCFTEIKRYKNLKATTLEVFVFILFNIFYLHYIGISGINDLSITWSGTGALNYNPTYIYLFDPKTATFSERYEFENADFFPKEQVVRGVQTGFSEVVGLYKIGRAHV